MGTVSARSSGKSTEATPTGAACLFVAGQPYSLIVLEPEPGREALVQYRLTKVAGKSYLATVDLDGHLHCECGDFTFRREHSNRGPCKHLGALAAVGLLNLRWRSK